MLTVECEAQSTLSIDCIKVCPYDPRLVAMAYYQTNPTTEGAISVTNIQQTTHIQHINTLPSPPLLHLEWTQHLQHPDSQFILAAATRTNLVLLYTYTPQTGQLKLANTLKIALQQTQEELFCLYLDIKTQQDHYDLVVSTDKSTVHHYRLSPLLTIQAQQIYSKHEFAVWTCRLDPFHPGVFAAGDEVNSIYLYSQGQLTSTNKGLTHKAGICDLTFHPKQEHLLYSGGFDGIVAAYDIRQLRQPLHTHQQVEDSTAWRVIPSPHDSSVLVCNSSQKVFQILRGDLQEQLWNSGKTHTSLAYAADWTPFGLLTASFYDHKLCSWAKV